jgi:hypothetical protein
MRTIQITLPDDTVFQKLEAIAREQRVSVEDIARKLLSKFTSGNRPEKAKRDKNEVIDEMAGSWTAQEAAEFERNTAPFREIDQALWQ